MMELVHGSMIVNGTNKYVTEMTEETQDDHIDHIGEKYSEAFD